MKNIRNGLMAFSFIATSTLTAFLGSGAPALAQSYGYVQYNSWQPGWDHGQYDRRHIIVGRVSGFRPYRLWVHQRNGVVRQIDLKPGTVIRPLGATPQPGNRVAVFGYYSGGTFIANRIVVR